MCGEGLAPFVGSRSIAARVEDVIEQSLPADVVLLNPPRVGVHERVTAAIAAVSPAPRAVIYVSCDPATLARDVARLPGYRIASLRAFDMFPQTAHVETVCELVPDGKTRVKYYVSVNGEDHEVTLDEHGVQVDGEPVSAAVESIDGSPVRMVTIGDEVHRVVVRPGGARCIHVVARRLSLRRRGARRTRSRDSRAVRQERGADRARLRSSRRCPGSSCASTCNRVTKCKRGRDWW